MAAASQPQPLPVTQKPQPVSAVTPQGRTFETTASDEQEIPPPPPEKGISFTWQREKSGLTRRTNEVPPEVIVSAGVAPVTPAATSATAAPVASASPGVAAAAPIRSAPSVSLQSFVGATQPVTLPPAPVPWKFREQTSAWADVAAERVRGAVASSNASVAAALTRLVRGALMHRDVYRDAAARPELNTEALCIAGALILAGFVGIWLTGLGALYYGISIGALLRLAVIRAVSWVAAIFAIQAAAKSLHKLDLPAAAWFRALIYAQAPSLLMFVPVIGGFSGIWSAVCAVAALHDVEGRDTTAAIILAVIGGVAASIGTYIGTALLRSFF